MDKQDIKTKLKQFWHFVWEDDSLASWVVNIILAFVIIRFIIYPGLSLLFGTSLPIVAVVSGSMEHQIVSPYTSIPPTICGKTFEEEKRVNFDTYWELCGSWYTTYTNITKDEFNDFPFKNGFNKGDIMFLKSAKHPEKIKIGEVIVFQSNAASHPIIHRVIAIEQKEDSYHFTTKGDHNSKTHGELGEQDIHQSRYLGKAFLRLPYLGWIKVTAVCGYKKLKGTPFIACMKY